MHTNTGAAYKRIDPVATPTTPILTL